MEQGSSHEMVMTVCAAIAAGIFLTALCRRMEWPAIILLVAGGVVLGPECLNIVRPEALGEFLPVIVSLAVGVILFEGGLTLDLHGFSQGSGVIQKLLTVGVLITWLLTALFVWLILKADAGLALLCGSLVIVTGPTVIVPLLKRIQVNTRLHSILHWEGVLIDSVGVFVALLCFEWLIGQSGERAVANFGIRVVMGLVFGAAGGLAVAWVLRSRIVPETMRNGFALGSAVAIFGATEATIFEAGLLAVTVAGLVLGWKQPIGLKQVREFKAEITDLLIGLLFILLSARLRLDQFMDFGWQGVAAVAMVLVVVRLVNVLVSTHRSGLTIKEKLFLGWVAPRGIVAASMSSLFAIALAQSGAVDRPRLLETFTYSVIVATVVLQGLSAGPLAKWLGLRRPTPTGWVIVGAHRLSRRLARFIRDEAGLSVVLLDSNPRHVRDAQAEGLQVFCVDALDTSISEARTELETARFLLAVTDNSELNELLCHRWGDVLGRENVFRWSAVKGDKPESDTTHGRIVLFELPSPSVVSSELRNRAARIESASAESTGGDAEGQVLCAARRGEVFLPGGRSDNGWQAGDKLLRLKRVTGRLARGFEAGDVMDLVAGDLGEAFTQVKRSLKHRFETLDPDSLWDAADHAAPPIEPLPVPGAAMVRAYSRQIKQHTCILARFAGGLPMAGEARRLRLLFLIISPEEDLGGHIALIGELSDFCSDAAHIETVLRAEKASEAADFLRSHRSDPG